jgi:hypothetical protein
MSMLRKLGLLMLLAGAFSVGNAQVLDMQGASGARDEARPTRGMTAARVEQRFGAPERRIAAVGDPPIARWEYRDFVVFFEYDRVIHAVAKR